MKKILSVAVLAWLMLSCDNLPDNPGATTESANEDVETLKAEVMAIHDSAMAKMSTLSSLQSKLKETWQSTKDSLPYLDMHRNLQHYKDDMMDWMRNYEVPENTGEPEVRDYLLEEKRAVGAINAEMDKGIAEARFLLENPELSTETTEEEGEQSLQRKE